MTLPKCTFLGSLLESHSISAIPSSGCSTPRMSSAFMSRSCSGVRSCSGISCHRLRLSSSRFFSARTSWIFMLFGMAPGSRQVNLPRSTLLLGSLIAGRIAFSIASCALIESLLQASSVAGSSILSKTGSSPYIFIFKFNNRASNPCISHRKRARQG
eukprot:XP_001708137.1 Hypothetical protein GL50803_20494 [Giardia lamblia ATCC 50803]